MSPIPELLPRKYEIRNLTLWGQAVHPSAPFHSLPHAIRVFNSVIVWRAASFVSLAELQIMNSFLGFMKCFNREPAEGNPCNAAAHATSQAAV